jgi:SAM-dependent methyltransferase
MGDWEWDPTVFEGSARFYERGRLPYAPGLAAAFREALDLDGSGRLLDVGTGPGVVALTLAPLFAEVVGVDADPEMIVEAERSAKARGTRNTRWRTLRAEALPADLGTFDVITFAQSFHWMRRDEVARTVRAMLEPGRGRLVLVSAYTRDGIETESVLAHPSPPREAISALIERYLGSTRRAGQGIRPEPPWDEDDVLHEAGFSGPDVIVVPDDREIVRSVDDVVASVFAVSRSAPHLFGDRLASFEADLRSILADASPDGVFSARTGANTLRIFEPTD